MRRWLPFILTLLAASAFANVPELRFVPPILAPAYDRVQTYKDADGNLIQYKYDNNGNLTNLIYPGGKIVTYFYDSLNRLTNVTDWSNRKTVMTYDLASQMKSLTRPNGTVRTIEYDAAGQTTNIVEKTAMGYPIALFRFNWNLNATMQWEFAAPLPHPVTVPTRTMTFDDDNRIATFNGTNVTHDTDGNLTSGPLTNSTFATYTYDARNRLVGTLSAASQTYSYDPAGNRSAISNATGITKFIITPNSQVLMRIKGNVTNYYIYGAGLLYEITETATVTNTLTYHYDYRGSTVALTDNNGTVADRIEYSAYATTTYRTGTNDTPFLFNGRYGVQTDSNGLLYMRARYYNPYLCRFLSADPSGFGGGLNFYAYASGDPINLIDPTGFGAQDAQSQYTSFGNYLGIAGNRNGMLVIMNNSNQVVQSAQNHGVSPNLVAATIMFEHRGWGLVPGSQYVEGALSYGKSLVNPNAKPSYGFAQLGPEARANSNLSVAQSLTAVGSIEGAAAWLAHKKQELIGAGITNPSNAQIASRYNAGTNIDLGAVNSYGQNVGAIINEVQWNFPKSNK